MTGRKRHSLGGREVSLVVEVTVSVTTEHIIKERKGLLYYPEGYLQVWTGVLND